MKGGVARRDVRATWLVGRGHCTERPLIRIVAPGAPRVVVLGFDNDSLSNGVAPLHR